ncbi:MBOAT family protein [Oscillibacter sp.]|uniref:MBOAT family O-acyltransferase n=1 Tax=Oscillibacter sp. TaxID=1945593 RepID=UPI00260A205B|nr:MBOAT family protein [Oscillibacter sp.]MDD3347460.1 MBOAT family protein [Oscillibacter sp.]
MAFSSVAFLFGFLPAVLLFYFLTPSRLRTGRNFLLLVFSLAFYLWGGLRLLPVLLASCVGNWAAALLASTGRRWRKGVFLAGIFLNLAALGYFKYTGFLLGSLQTLGLSVATPAIVLPAGISFFTFQAIAYLTDVYRGTIPPERSLFRFTLFMAFFPQLLQGPILRYGAFAPALTDRQETAADAQAGATRFCFGLAKKVLLADALGQIADGAFAAGDRLTVSLAWLGAIAYTLQLYFDFSGYTDMAIGLGRVFGFHLPENFNYPYLAKSASEFWRRWHMTLSFWFRDYVYIPLGGNRCAKGRQLVNLFIVWMLTGLWHGSAWNFVLWGLYYAVVLAGEKFLWGRGLEKLPAALRHGYALVLIIVGWVFFRAGSLAQVGEMLSALFGAAPGGAWSGETAYYLRQFRWELLVAIPAALPVKNALQAWLSGRRSRLSGVTLAVGPQALAFCLFGWSVVRLLSSTFRSFLYFQF